VTGYGVFSPPGEPPRLGYRTSDGILDLSPLGQAFTEPSLNALLARGPEAWAIAHERVLMELDRGHELIAERDVQLHLPFEVADYVDFYASLEHASNIGRIFRPDLEEPLLPNWRHLPVGYHGRAGTVVVSGSDIIRPCGQRKAPADSAPAYGPSRRLDVELELGFVVGVPSLRGESVRAERFREHVFGVVLVNDWSARDIQAWEYQPLGPFLGKSFATSTSAWVTPLAELEHAWVAGPPQQPDPLPYLQADGAGHLDIDVEIELDGEVVSRSNARDLYWSPAQMLAHMTVNGASLRTGDLYASGTISGAARGSEGSLIELTWNGERPLRLADGGERTFLEDGDEIVMRGRAGDVELGEVRGRVVPARC
jgi:fumarylacetoacetase